MESLINTTGRRKVRDFHVSRFHWDDVSVARARLLALTALTVAASVHDVLAAKPTWKKTLIQGQRTFLSPFVKET